MNAAMKRKAFLNCAIGSGSWSKSAAQQNGCIGLGAGPKAAGEPHPGTQTPCGGGQGSGIAKQVSRGHGDGAPCLDVGTHRPSWSVGASRAAQAGWLGRCAAVGLAQALRHDAEPP